MGRAPCCDKANVKKGPWSPEEDAKLKSYIDTYGTGGNWIALPQKIGLKRCGKSCRLRWLNYLRPNLKHGGFTEEEDSIICSLYISIGSRWSVIAAQLPGRTDNDIKNYWNTRLKKKLLGRRKQSSTNRAWIGGQDSREDSSFNLQNLSSSALERLQLHLHLQSLHSPLSFYNNPALWPKLNHKMIETLNSMNQNQNIEDHDQQPHHPPPVLEHQDELANSMTNCFSSSETAINGNQGFISEAEIDDLLNNRSSASSSFPTDQIADQFDGFEEMGEVSKDMNLGWWSNEFDMNSTSSNSWDSATMLGQSEEMYGDFDIGYNSMQ